MATTVDAQVPLTSSAPEAELGIGEAARLLGVAPSAIRYYESEGLLDAPRGADGRRRYGPAQLRALAFVAIGRDLGVGIASIRDALHPDPGGWAEIVDAQIAELDAQIARANRARALLLAARECRAPAPVRDCAYLRSALDAWIAGAPLPDPAASHTAGVPHHGDPPAGNAGTHRDR